MKLFLAVLALSFVCETGFARRKRVDLDSMMIKGELHGDDRLMILARRKSELKNYIQFRKSYKKEILQELPVPKPKRSF